MTVFINYLFNQCEAQLFEPLTDMETAGFMLRRVFLTYQRCYN